jgi:hypothetical protein
VRSEELKNKNKPRVLTRGIPYSGASLFIIIAVLAFTSAAVAGEGRPVLSSIDFKAGKTFRMGNAFPIHVRVESRGGPFRGSLVLAAGSRLYRAPLDVPAGGMGDVVFDVVFTDETGDFMLKAVSEGGTVEFDVSKEAAGLRGISAAKKLALIVGGDLTGELRDRMELFSLEPVEVGPENLPRDRSGYMPFDFVVFTKVDWAMLAPEVRTALDEYVRFGGRLFLPGYASMGKGLELSQYFRFTPTDEPLVVGRRGLGCVFVPNEHVPLTGLREHQKREMLDRMRRQMGSVARAFRAPGPVPAIDPAAEELFERPERFAGFRIWWKIILCAYCVAMWLTLTAGRRWWMLALVVAASGTLTGALALPPGNRINVETVSVRYALADTPETIDVRFFGLTQFERRPGGVVSQTGCPPLDFGEGRLVVGVVRNYAELFEDRGVYITGEKRGIAGVPLNATFPKVFYVEKEGGSDGVITIKHAGQGRARIGNRTGRDLAGGIITDFRSAVRAGRLGRGQSFEFIRKTAVSYGKAMRLVSGGLGRGRSGMGRLSRGKYSRYGMCMDCGA